MKSHAAAHPDSASVPDVIAITSQSLPEQAHALARARAFAEPLLAGETLDTGENTLAHADAVAAILQSIGGSQAMQAACYLVYASAHLNKPREVIANAFGDSFAELAVETTKLVQVQRQARAAQVAAARSGTPVPMAQTAAMQTENVRKMLLAFSRDLRVVMLRLASRLQTLRHFAASKLPLPPGLAAESLQVFAPLANRLGIWEIKWEMEDLSFRFLEPDTYRQVAKLLDEKRVEREAYIEQLRARLESELKAQGIPVHVQGRPKHIYSIVKKMRGKSLGFDQVHDIRALRIVVDSIPDCYAALSWVHSQFQPLTEEFDDYIAKPKANDYRSLHTAVVGPDSRVLEVQVRTHEMHQHAELGVAAHWRYKEAVKGDPRLDHRISWLRGVLEWKDELADATELAEYFKTDLFQDMVYAVTPQGRVVDLPRGSTPVDFAYHLHTELGHRCRGAKVNGQIVPLTFALANGQRVEIIAAKEGGPSRDWLNPALGYLKSNRARAKVRQWFNSQQLDEAMAHGRALLDKDLQRLGKTGQNLEELASRLAFGDVNALFAALGRGELAPRRLQSAVLGEEVAENKMPVRPVHARPAAAPGGILIVGVDKLLTVLARCCKPAPPDRIVGFVTRGRGVTVHRADCRNVGHLPQERMIASEWGKTGASKFQVDIEVMAGGHPALMRDILDVFTREKVRVASSTSYSLDLNAKMAFTLEVEGLAQLARLLASVRDTPGVESARRK